MSAQAHLARLGITLPPAAGPVGAFVPWVRSGALIYLSGHIAMRDGTPWTGRLGDGLTTTVGQAAARSAALGALGTLRAAVDDLDAVSRVVKAMVLVNSASDFTEQHLVANGASALLVEIFGEVAGAHARTAFGVAQLPFGACVEVDLVVEVNR
jgi:enamine deaminase RidA (YjgF/YER057c/UK114 family)